ncbi:hypothetical protein SGM_6370 [Streptomyces griseoaurantiacus M045]|uniref:Uncharacterized protein n=1 Tax=Streptomyces griseoaurantiacus M045 TaxID=996637 RepID=F3NTS0_9ACTN|nr:hypothetical protein SGM_6370 [Streptomyces griseoaurantiacus M045]
MGSPGTREGRSAPLGWRRRVYATAVRPGVRVRAAALVRAGGTPRPGGRRPGRPPRSQPPCNLPRRSIACGSRGTTVPTGVPGCRGRRTGVTSWRTPTGTWRACRGWR